MSLTDLRKRIDENIDKALARIAESFTAAIRPLAPFKTGNLRNSINVNRPIRRGKFWFFPLTMASYGTPVNVRHKTMSRFVERGVKSVSDSRELEDEIKAAIRKAIKE